MSYEVPPLAFRMGKNDRKTGLFLIDLKGEEVSDVFNATPIFRLVNATAKVNFLQNVEKL